LISFTAIGRSIAKAHTVLEQYYQPLVEQKRSDHGTAEKHRDALIGEFDTLNWELKHPLNVGG
jgi:hypothetical protein